MRRIIYLITAILFSIVVNAQKNVEKDNGFAVWLSGGYDQYCNFQPDCTPVGGGGGVIGLGYDLTLSPSGMLMQVGAEFGVMNSMMRNKNFIYSVDMMDTQGDRMNMIFDFTDVKETLFNVQAAGQLLLGYEHVKSGFYFLVGPKITYTFLNTLKTESDVRSTGRYVGYIGDDGKGLFGEEVPIPDHYLKTEHRVLTGKSDNKFKLSLSTELGYSFTLHQDAGSPKSGRMRVAAFCEYGWLFRGNTNNSAPQIVNLSSGEYQPQVNHYLWRGTTTGISHLYAGLKLTYILRTHTSVCKTCR